MRGQDGGEAVVEDATGGLPVRYCCQAVALLWCSFAPSTTSDAEKLATLERLSDAAALVLRGAILAEDLEAGALPVDGLQELGGPDCKLETAEAVERPGGRETGTR